MFSIYPRQGDYQTRNGIREGGSVKMGYIVLTLGEFARSSVNEGNIKLPRYLPPDVRNYLGT